MQVFHINRSVPRDVPDLPIPNCNLEPIFYAWTKAAFGCTPNYTELSLVIEEGFPADILASLRNVPAAFTLAGRPWVLFGYYECRREYNMFYLTPTLIAGSERS